MLNFGVALNVDKNNLSKVHLASQTGEWVGASLSATVCVNIMVVDLRLIVATGVYAAYERGGVHRSCFPNGYPLWFIKILSRVYTTTLFA